MPPSEPSRVFLSYARTDGAALAQRLQEDLNNQGFDVWLDKQRIAGGAVWTEVIEAALDQAEYVLALLTEGSYVSDICRAEQLRALRKGKCVIALMAQTGAEVPLHLEPTNYRDFTTEIRYPQAFSELLADLHARNGIELKPEFRRTRYNTVPPLPPNFVKRPEAVAALRDALITDGGSRHIALTALKGMGGIGKTVLAQALCHDEVVQQAFPDGIIWITVGKEASMDLTRMREVGKALDDDLSCYDSDLAAANQYRNTIRGKAALIVVDDVWKASDLEPLRAEGSPCSRLLFTTRDASIGRFAGAREHSAGLMNAEHSRELLASWVGLASSELPVVAEELIVESGNLPLALSVIGAMLRDASPNSWGDTLELLRNADLSAIQEQLPEGQNDFFKAVEASFQSLKPEWRERYKALAVLLEDMAAPLPILQALWNVDEAEARRISRNLSDRSLAQHNSADETVRLHDLQLDYVRAQYPKDDKQALKLIHGATRLSSHVIDRDPGQFVSQMAGRLFAYRNLPGIRRFLGQIASGAPVPWLRTLRASLHPPTTSLLRTLEGHSETVYGVAVTVDGKRAISTSWDKTLRVWDLESGRVLLRLEGHSEGIRGVAVTADGKRAVSASSDRTLKVWDLESGQLVWTLEGHSDNIQGVAVTPDGKRAVSASYDKTLKVWDLERGQIVQTLKGHSSAVHGVAVTADGKRAVSASFDHTLKVWDLDSGRLVRTLTGHSETVYGVAVTADGKRAVSASFDHTLKVWDLDSGRDVRTLVGHSGPVEGVAVTADGKRAISASFDHTLKVWDLDSGRDVRTLVGHSSCVYGVAVTADGKRAVSASHDHKLKVWDVQSGDDVWTPEGHSRAVYGVAVTADGKRAVSASWDQTLRVWDLESGRIVWTLEGHSSAVQGVAVTADGKRAVSASWDGTLKVWDLASGREVRTLVALPAASPLRTRKWIAAFDVERHSSVFGVAVTVDGKRAVSASSDHTLKVWDLEGWRDVRTLMGHSDRVCGVAVTADGKRAVSASADHTLKVWDLESGLDLWTLVGHSDSVQGVAVTADGKRAVSASSDGTLKVWDLESGRDVRTLMGHSDRVCGVAVTADGKSAVSASHDHTLKVWDMESGRVLATFSCDAQAECCTFIGENSVIAGDDGGRLYFLVLENVGSKPLLA